MRSGIRSLRWTRAARSDSGITTLQVLIMFPVVMLIVGIAMQEALNYFAREVALAAAQDGVNAIRFNGTTDELQARGIAKDAVNKFLTENNNSFFINPSLYATAKLPVITPPGRNNETTEITVELRGGSISLIPGLSVSVDEQSWGFVETFSNGGG